MGDPAIVSALNIVANLVVIVILPLVIFLVKHIYGIRKEVHDRIDRVEQDHRQFREDVAKRYLSENAVLRIVDSNRELFDTKLTAIADGVGRLERWIGRVADKADQNHTS
jgi:hypothetical protein